MERDEGQAGRLLRGGDRWKRVFKGVYAESGKTNIWWKPKGHEKVLSRRSWGRMSLSGRGLKHPLMKFGLYLLGNGEPQTLIVSAQRVHLS